MFVLWVVFIFIKTLKSKRKLLLHGNFVFLLIFYAYTFFSMNIFFPFGLKDLI